MNKNIELRSVEEDIILTIPVNKKSKLLTDGKGKRFIEVITKECLEKAKAELRSIRVLFNHKPYVVLGESEDIQLTQKGLEVRFKANETMQELAKNGEFEVSFGFKKIKDTITQFKDFYLRQLDEIEITEISLLDIESAYGVETRSSDSERQRAEAELYLMKVKARR